MNTRLSHRGPDDDGLWINEGGNLVLGQTRLSIIDLSTGTMPLSNFDESLWIVFNGEVYNYIELKIIPTTVTRPLEIIKCDNITYHNQRMLFP